jgi:DNA-binding LacI/PurR family transcriptional regulator
VRPNSDDWKEIYESLRNSILSGELPAGQQLPAGDAVALERGVSRHTAHRALEELQRQGLVVRRRGMGTVVAPLSPDHAPRHVSVALLVDFLAPGENHPSPDLLRGLHDGLGEDISLVVADSRNDGDTEARQLKRLARIAQGIVLYPTGKESSLATIGNLADEGFPLVMLDRVPPGVTADTVITDNEGATAMAIEELIRRGHRQIGFLSFHKPTFSSVGERYEGFRKAMGAAGLSPDEIEKCTRWFPADSDHVRPIFERLVQDALAFLLSGPSPITALFCVEDSFAHAAILASESLSLRLPEDLEIVAFSNWAPNALVRPWSVHRLAQNHYEFGRESARLLLSRLESPSEERRTVRVPAHLVLADAGIEPVSSSLSPSGE